MSDALRSRLLRIMRNEISSQNLQPSVYCQQQIEKLVGQGIQRMKSSNTAEQVNKVMQAEQNLKQLVTYFCKYSLESGTFPKLSDSAFDSALVTCPPLWPFRS